MPACRSRPGSPGKPQRGRSIRVIPPSGPAEPLPAGEVGLLAIHRGDPGLMLGYWRRPEEEASAFRGDWFAGGDLAAFDADGYLWHHGRADDVMNAGGYRVSPLEVEAALLDCPGIAEVAVGEHQVRTDVSIIAAFVVRREGSAVDAAQILAHAATRLAAYKRPKQIFFVPALPRSAQRQAPPPGARHPGSGGQRCMTFSPACAWSKRRPSSPAHPAGCTSPSSAPRSSASIPSAAVPTIIAGR